MSWQDIVVSAGSLGFSIVLIPAMRSKDKPPAFTSFMFALILIGFVCVHASYQLWFGATCQAVLIIQWAIVGVQKLRQKTTGVDLSAISNLLRTQDNRHTQDPLFCLQVKKRDVGYPSDWGNDTVWVYDYPDEHDDQETEPEDTENWTEYGYVDRWSTVMVSFTEQACKDFVESNGHHVHGESRIFAETLWRCDEMIAIRKFIMELPNE
ncbi:MAG: hypothetical protein V3V10_07245 [Planctomycetota bacterium]